MSLLKICETCHISENDAKEMIVSHHQLKHLTPKNQIKEIKGLELSTEVIDWVKKTAKTLKISTDAVISGILKIELKQLESKKTK
jgi:hypothetical protein